MTAFFALFIIVFSAIYLLIIALMVVSIWKIYVKMGEPGWKSIIPFYSTWTLIDRLRKPQSWFWILMLVCFIYMMLLVFLMVAVKMAEIGSAEMDIFSILIYLVPILACAVVMIVYEIKIYHALSKTFGQGAGFTVGMILLPVIFFPVLAFGDFSFKPEEPGVPNKVAALDKPEESNGEPV
jgi:hypothetical protein